MRTNLEFVVTGKSGWYNERAVEYDGKVLARNEEADGPAREP